MKRFARDLAQSFQRKYRFVLPSATYHELMKALSGLAKMSKPEAAANLLSLNEKPETIASKISNSFTGGRATVEEQRRLGGIPEICPIYDMCVFHFREREEDLVRVYTDCRGGRLLCGEHKTEIIKIVLDFARRHQQKRRQFIEKAKEILEVA